MSCTGVTNFSSASLKNTIPNREVEIVVLLHWKCGIERLHHLDGLTVIHIRQGLML